MRPHTEDGFGHPSFEDFLAARVYLQGAAEDNVPGAPDDDDALATIVLSADGNEDLAAALDEALMSEAFIRYCNHAASAPRATLRQVPMGPSFSVLQAREELFGSDVAKRLNQADAIWLNAARLAARIAHASLHPQQDGPSAAATTLGFLDDTSIPLELRRLLLLTWHGLLASLVLGILLGRGQTNALVPALADATFKGARAAWRLFRGESSLLPHQKREEWVMGAFKRAAEGDGHFAVGGGD